jgi:hypothetical protein
MRGIKVWEPMPGEELKGTFHFEALSPTVRTDDGTIWLLPPDADERLKALDLDEGERVSIACSGRRQ